MRDLPYLLTFLVQTNNPVIIGFIFQLKKKLKRQLTPRSNAELFISRALDRLHLPHLYYQVSPLRQMLISLTAWATFKWYWQIFHRSKNLTAYCVHTETFNVVKKTWSVKVFTLQRSRFGQLGLRICPRFKRSQFLRHGVALLAWFLW